MKYAIVWRDGSVTENLSFEESDKLITERPTEWGCVRFMEHGKDCSEENVEKRKEAWGRK